MKKLIIFALFILLSCSKKNDEPTDLTVELIRNSYQAKIQDSKPEFSWLVPYACPKQTAYQILLSETKEDLVNENNLIWNSGIVEKSYSTEIEYSGSDLEEQETYYWKVRVWGDAEKDPTTYSKISSFQTGLFQDYKTTPNIIQSSNIEPTRIEKITNQHYFIDFGKDAFGQLIIELNSEIDDSLIIKVGEKIINLNQVDTEPGGTIRYEYLKIPIFEGQHKYKVNFKKNNRNTSGAAILLNDSIGVVLPFRYCEIEQIKSPLQLIDIEQKAFFHYFEDNSSLFESSDSLLNAIWNLCKYSIKATSFTGLYVDGDRERIPYEADAFINQLGHYCVDQEYSMARVTNEYFIENPTWPTEWILHTVPMFYYDLMYTGNYESIEYYYDELKSKTLMSLERSDGLISSNNINNDIMKSIGFTDSKSRIRDIVDWPPGQNNTGWKLANNNGERDGYDMVNINTVVNSFYYHNLKLMSVIAGYLNKNEDSIFYFQKALTVKKTINNLLLDKVQGIYIDGEKSNHSSLHANMIPLAFGIVPAKYKSSVVEFIKSRGMACSVYGSQYLLEALYNSNESDYAYRLLTAKHDRSWYNMIKTGSTITMEAWDMKYKPNSDWNHAWGAAPANIIPRMMWGIQPIKPGFAEMIIKPQITNLTSSKIVHPTIKGQISAEYKKNNDEQNYKITIPSNMNCTFVVPQLNNKTFISINGILQNIDKDKFQLNNGVNEIVIK